MSGNKYLRKLVLVSVSLIVAGTSILPLLVRGSANAYNIVEPRSINMSTSQVSASSVTYEVEFTAASSYTVKGIIVDFCSETGGSAGPIIGGSCTAPSGFSVKTGGTLSGNIPALNEQGGANALSTGWSFSLTTAANTNTVALTNSTGVALTSGSSILDFKLTSITNPSTSCASTGACTFYARILTYTTTAAALAYTSASPGVEQDAGGIALSTATQITITSYVQEQLSFCVYTGGSCGTGNSFLLGDTNGVLYTSGPFVDKETHYDISTNAANNAVVNIYGPTLTNGGNTITAIGGSEATSAADTDQFGLCNYQSAGSGTLVTQTPYNANGATSGSGSCNGTSQTANVGTTTGGDNSAGFAFVPNAYDEIAYQDPGSGSTGDIAFIGNVSTTQTAGIYTTTLTLIATGTY